jgi:hypothetical protein
MWTDPVVEEIHQIRQKLLAEAGDDLDIYLAQARRRAEQGGRVVAQDIRSGRTELERSGKKQDLTPGRDFLTRDWQETRPDPMICHGTCGRGDTSEH